MNENPTNYRPGWPAAVIASGHRTGVLGMRNLARRGVPVFGVDCDTAVPGWRQRYGAMQLCPNPDEDSQGWLEFMLELAHKLPPKPVLIPASDQFLSAIGLHADRLGEVYRIGAAPKLQRELSIKASLYSLAARYGMPIPRTDEVNSAEDVARFAGQAQFPCLLKPMSAREWEFFEAGHPLYLRKVAVAGTPEELLRHYELVRHVSPKLTVQEIIQGPDSAKMVYSACYSHAGERLGWSLFRELRCDSVGFGSASACESHADPEAADSCNRFLQGAGCRGLCEIELKRDCRNGKLMMIEANPRLTVTGDASTYVGVDLCWTHYLDLSEVDVCPIEPQPRGVRHIALRRDAKAIRALGAQKQLRWTEVVKSYRWPVAFYDFDLQEKRYSLETLEQAARILLAPAVGRIRRLWRPVRAPQRQA